MSDYMPVKVITGILKRLPVKSLGKCRSVCKSWNTLISHPCFISTHLQASLSNNTPFLLLRCEKNGPKNYFLHYDNDAFDEFKQLRFLVSGCLSDFAVLGSCNGLLCLILLPGYLLNFYLWNPSIQKCISLPRPSLTEAVDLNVGFGFDSRTNDYKLFMVGVEKDGSTSWNKPYLFSLNENCWKRVTATPPNYTFDAITGISLPFVNGALHWLGYQNRNNDEYRNVILGFDLSAEVFFVINLPESFTSFRPYELSIMNYGESSIAVSTHPLFDEHELWVMKEYGVVESWTKVLAFNIQRTGFPIFSGFRKNGEVLLVVDDGELASHDLNCHQMELRGVEVGTRLLSVEGSYVESLVLLDKGVDVRSGSHVRTGT